MRPSPSSPARRSAARPVPGRGRGFSFIELLFAVAVMGIGFIMVAAIFPIGLQQTKLTLDETAAAAAARGTAARLQQLAAQQIRFAGGPNDITGVMPHTAPVSGIPALGQVYRGQVRTFNDPRDFTSGANIAARRNTIWHTVSSELISPSDPRNATAVLYKRDAVGARDASGNTVFAGQGTAQLITVNAQIGTQSEYKLTVGPQPIYDLEPRPVAVQVVYDPERQNYVASFFSVTELDAASGGVARGGYPNGTFAGPPTADWDDVLDNAIYAVSEGAFVVISDDRITTAAARGRLNGRILKLGNRRTDLGGLTFDLAPGYEFTPDPGPDGYLNGASASNDDIVAIGVDSGVSAADLRSGIDYSVSPPAAAGATVMRPLGSSGPDGTTIIVGGSDPRKGAVALVLGRGFADPNFAGTAAAGYDGAIQDIAAFTTFVSVPN